MKGERSCRTPRHQHNRLKHNNNKGRTTFSAKYHHDTIITIEQFPKDSSRTLTNSFSIDQSIETVESMEKLFSQITELYTHPFHVNT